MRGRYLRLVGLAIAPLACAATALAATGCLYLIRPVRLPGPAVGDALPLDELSKRSSISIVLFVGVWAAAGLLMGAIARAVRAERLSAALLLALGVGGWCYLVTGVSILVVRQIPAHDAFAAAAELRAVYLPAALAGLAGALVARTGSSRRRRAPLIVAWAVAATGLLGLLDAILPARQSTLLATLTPERVHPLAQALVAPLGLALLVVARGLARRKRRAWQLALGILASLATLHLLHGFDYGAIVSAVAVLVLVACRHAFDAQGDPASHPRVAARALGFLAAIYAYGSLALWVNRVSADQPFTLRFALRETSKALVGLSVRGSQHLDTSFGDWFSPSVLILGLLAGATVLHSWLAPWRHRARQEQRERALASSIVAEWGIDTLAPFLLRADKSYFFGEDERAVLAYTVVGGVAIVSGDPVGPPDAVEQLLTRFIELAHGRDWRVAILGASERFLELYRGHGLRALYHGDEAVLETATFSLEGRAIRKVRQSVQRLERAGFHADVLAPSEIGPELRELLEEIARTWRGNEPERGFTMALDALFRLDEALFVIGRGPDGEPRGFLHFAFSQPGSALSLSSMPRLRSTPNGFNEWLICETVTWARDHGVDRISLNFAPFAALLAPDAPLSRLQKVERRALLSLKGHFQLDNLLCFNRKFFPTWQRRFVVYERRRDLPRVGLAALAAEAYLPFAPRAAAR